MINSKDSVPRRRLAVFLLLCMALYAVIASLHGVLLGYVIDTWQLSSSSQGFPASALFAGSFAAVITTFVLSGKLRKWRVLMFSLALCAAALTLLRVTGVFSSYVAVWAVIGIGAGLLDTLLSACMGQLYQGKTAVLTMCLLHTSYGLASTGAPIACRSLLDHGIVWNSIYLVPAAMAGVLFLIAVIFRIPRFDGTPSVSDHAGNIFAVVRESRLLFWVAAMFFHGFFLSGLSTWINRYSESAGAVSAIMPAMSFMYLGLMISRLIMAFLPVPTDKYVKTAGFAAGAVLAAGLMFPPALNICILISGLFFGAMIPCMLSLSCGRLKENTLTATTALMLALYLGEALSAPVIGALEKAVNLRAGIFSCALCMVLCSLSAAMDRPGI